MPDNLSSIPDHKCDPNMYDSLIYFDSEYGVWRLLSTFSTYRGSQIYFCPYCGKNLERTEHEHEHEHEQEET